MDKHTENSPPEGKFSRKACAAVLEDLGIARDTAHGAVLAMAEYMARDDRQPTLAELCDITGQPPSAEGQIREAVASALHNLAVLGNKDISDPVFNRYHGKLFRPWQLQLEMQYLKDGIEPRGRPSAGYFMRSLADLSIHE